MKFKGLVLVMLFVGLFCFPFLSYGKADIAVLRKKVEQGDAEAQLKLGTLYYSGTDVSQNYRTAVKWFRLSADQGNVEALSWLGRCYYRGEGVRKNLTEAENYYSRASQQKSEAALRELSQLRLEAEQGNSNKQYLLGEKYSEGANVAQDYIEAVKWYRLAAEQGHADAQNNLGDCYYYGRGLPQSISSAKYWWSLAATQGNWSAKYSLDRITPRASPQPQSENVYYTQSPQKKPADVEPQQSVSFPRTTKELLELQYGRGSMDFPSILISFLITWIIGLTPPLILRYAVAKRPFSKWAATGLAIAFCLVNTFVFILLGSKSKTHAVCLTIAFISYWILSL
jgi:TPR repeat protein